MKYSFPVERITSKIYLIRGQKVMLDRELAELYGVETKVLKQAVRRNTKRFPGDFMVELNAGEFKNLRSQFVTSTPIEVLGCFNRRLMALAIAMVSVICGLIFAVKGGLGKRRGDPQAHWGR